MELSAILERAIELAERNERADLCERLAAVLARVRDPNVRVLVVGEFKQGKSLLINALVGAPVCAVDDDIATSVTTTVRYGATPEATVLLPAPGTVGRGERPETLVRTPIPLDALAEYVSERGNPSNVRGIAGVDVALPRRLLTGGLALVDTPGVGGLESVHSLMTIAALPTAHAMLFVTDASQEFTAPELRFLRQAARVCREIAVVMTKIDLVPQWRTIADLDRRHLDAAELQGVPIYPVSSTLHVRACERGDLELEAESGFPELAGHLRRNVVARAATVARRGIANELRATAELLSLSLEVELGALSDPATTPARIARLQEAKEHTDELRKQASRWQTTLNDGIADLIADLDFDLRDRLRRVQREATTAIDRGDPGPAWPELVTWFGQRVTAAVSDTFVWTDERARWLAEEVASHFEAHAVHLPSIAVDDTDGVLDAVEPMGEIDAGRLSVLQKAFVGMRGSYGGVLMIGLVTSLVGMAVINPVSLAAGVLLGGKAHRDDKAARLARRQADAKLRVRQQVDDVTFQVGKQLKDRLRHVQRATRDHFTEIADAYHRSIADSLAAAQAAATASAAESAERIRHLRDERDRVSWLRRAADAIEGRAEEGGSGAVAASAGRPGSGPAARPASGARPAPASASASASAFAPAAASAPR